ncbi:MAG: cytochrome c biogenesis protein CcdA [Candidatus Neomarinimicrobiota bacterium]
MLTELFTALDGALGSGFGWAVLAAVGWGVISVLLSPCHLTSIPLVVGLISSQDGVNVKRSTGLALVFAVGILLSIAMIGGITVGLGRMLGDVGRVGNYLVAGIFFLVGLYLLELLRLPQTGINLQRLKTGGIGGALLLGLVFGLALGPCTFAFMAPVLGAVLHLSVTSPAKAGILLAGFGVGHSIVIVLAGTLTGWVQNYLDWSEKSRGTLILQRVCGVLIIIGGIYILVVA